MAAAATSPVVAVPSKSTHRRPSAVEAALLQQHARHGYDELLDALAPSSTRLQDYLDNEMYTEQEKRVKVKNGLLLAASAGQIEMLEWLLETQRVGPRRAVLPKDDNEAGHHEREGKLLEEDEDITPRLDVNAKDENGSPAIVLAAVFGHSDAVRLLVNAGADINATDSRGWSALFWAFQRGDLPLSSFLINRKAKTTIRSTTGLAAIDMIRKGSAGEVFRETLRDIEDSECESSHAAHTTTDQQEDEEGKDRFTSAIVFPTSASSSSKAPHVRPGAETPLSRRMGGRRRPSTASLPPSPGTPNTLSGTGKRNAKHASLPATANTASTFGMKRPVLSLEEQHRLAIEEAAREAARTLEVDYNLLAMDEEDDLADDPTETDILGQMQNLAETGEDGPGDGETNEGNESKSTITSIFDWEECLNTQMLSFSMEELPALLDLVMEVRPSRAKEVRTFPANVLFLATRYASRYGGEDLLSELLLGAIDRIEASIHSLPEDLANSSFWLSNCVLLLHYLRKDSHTEQTTLEYQDNLYDTIRQIFVFCIRDVERRMDKILDASMLDHEALPGYSDVRFEGEWRFVKALTNRSKKDSYASLSGSPSSSSSSRPSVLGLFGSPDRNAAQDTAGSHTPPRSMQNQDNSFSARARTPSMPAVLRAGMFSSPSTTTLHQPLTIVETPSPKTITTLLSATLFVMQRYDYAGHPAIVVQAFSQLLYWIAAELFNRILTRKRYLCRSKAIQIRLNVSAVEEWARTNHLPHLMVQAHFRPLNELLQWLQCLSSESSIDGLLTTMQNMRTINPVQLRRAVRDYRYEVEESKIAEECTQYLAQVQKDWERRRLMQGLDEAEYLARAPSSSSSASIDSQRTDTSVSLQTHESSRSSDPRSKAEKHIDDIFGDPYIVRSESFRPIMCPENHSELFDSRIMLPFSLPTANDALLISTPPSFGVNKLSRLHQDGHSTADMSIDLSRQIEKSGLVVKPRPKLPDDFFETLAQAQQRYDGIVQNTISVGLYGERRRANGSCSSGARTYHRDGDHWINWRSRLAEEVAG